MRNTEKSSSTKETVKETVTETSRNPVHYHKYENITLINKKLYGTARTLYDFMLAQSYLRTNDFVMSIAELAEGISRTPATTRIHLNTLIKLGFVTRIFRKDATIRNWNLKSLFIVHPVAIPPVALGAENQEPVNPVEYVDQNGYYRKIIVPPQENPQGKDIERSKEKDIYKELTIQAKDGLSQNSDNSDSETKPETREMGQTEMKPKVQAEPKKTKNPIKGCVSFDLSHVPDVMRPAAEFLLLKTGRTAITANECIVIREILNKKHTPTRVMKEIRKQAENFARRGKNLHMLTFNYIGKILAEQDSLKACKGKVSPKSPAEEKQVVLPEVQEPVGQILPVEEAEKIISEYMPSEKACEGIPTALKELYEKIQAKDNEITERYFSKYQQDEEGCYIFPEDMNEDEDDNIEITLDDYLRLKYPEADEEELRTDRINDQRGLQEAFEIDHKCAHCNNPETCPFNRKKARPWVMLNNHRLEVRYSPSLPCKHDKKQTDPQFETRIKRSGLTETQAKQTFKNYEHAGMPPEVVSAKAKAILAAKNKKSLIIAGKSGTGKTHLATAIAIDAMKNGQNVIFRTVPELLDELRRAAQEHTDFFGLMQKYKDVSCLVLDDWGKERTTQAGLDYMFQLIDYRYRNGMQTIVTTNALNMRGLMNQWNADKIEPIVSRILENGEWVTMRNADNYRLSSNSIVK